VLESVCKSAVGWFNSGWVIVRRVS
jgi:hypothetical protein